MHELYDESYRIQYCNFLEMSGIGADYSPQWILDEHLADSGTSEKEGVY
jgi:hypothetical protein